MSTVYGAPITFGGGGVEYNIFAGLTPPPVSNGALWIKAELDLKHIPVIFDSRRPAAPEEGTLFVKYFGESRYPRVLPIQQNGEFSYYVVSVQHYTAAGGWKWLGAYYGKDGAWMVMSTADYCFFRNPAGNMLEKVDRNGVVQWSADVSGGKADAHALCDIAIDWVNRKIYCVMESITNGTMCYLSCVNLDTGALISKRESYFGMATTASGGANIKLFPTLDKVVIYPSYQNVQTNQTFAVVRISDWDVEYGTSNANRTTIISKAGVVYNSCNNANTAELYKRYPLPDVKLSGASAGYACLHGCRNNQVFLTNTGGTANYIHRLNLEDNTVALNVSKIPLPAWDIKMLSTGDMLIGGVWGLYFCTYNGTVIENYKQLLVNQTVYAIEVAPDDTVYVYVNGGISRYNPEDDSFTSLGTTQFYPGGPHVSCFKVEPGDECTFPELYDWNEEEN